MQTSSSKFFEFEKKIIQNNFLLSEFKGWNGLLVMKITMSKDSYITDKTIISKHFNISDKEKVLVTVKGNLEILSNGKNYSLKEFDALNLYNENISYEIYSKSYSEFFLITAENLVPKNLKPKFFNFIKDLDPKDIWGGQCISRVFFGENLNIVMFDLKPGFKFHDEGHVNEQITWVIKGDMDFYVSKIKKKLSPNIGVDIGKSDSHGGLSNGAIGFDAFYPKRDEKKYQKNREHE